MGGRRRIYKVSDLGTQETKKIGGSADWSY